MDLEEMQNIVVNMCNDLIFEYRGKRYGITTEITNGNRVYQAWSGFETRLYVDEKELFSDPFFYGESLEELSGKIRVYSYA